MKTFQKIAKWILIILIILNLFILVSGKTYLYKTLANTYLIGRSGPSISEYKIFDNAEVKNGNTLEWQTAKDDNKKEIPDSILERMKNYGTVAFLIVKNDSIQHEQYWDGFGQDSYSNSFSMAKTFVSILVGIAIDEGKIKSVDQPVGRHRHGRYCLRRIG